MCFNPRLKANPGRPFPSSELTGHSGLCFLLTTSGLIQWQAYELHPSGSRDLSVPFQLFEFCHPHPTNTSVAAPLADLALSSFPYVPISGVCPITLKMALETSLSFSLLYKSLQHFRN